MNQTNYCINTVQAMWLGQLDKNCEGGGCFKFFTVSHYLGVSRVGSWLGFYHSELWSRAYAIAIFKKWITYGMQLPCLKRPHIHYMV